METPERIYLDHASAMPVDMRALQVAEPFLRGSLGNPAPLHSASQEAKGALNEARARVAALINAPKETTIIFTGGATEANNLAIKGTAGRNLRKGKHVVTSAIEHMSVLNPMKELQKSGFELSIVPVDPTGTVDLDSLEKAVTDGTTVVSVMYANNEVGTIQPIREVGRLAHEKGAYLHVDATAAAGRIPVDVQADGIDLMTISSVDMYGPPGAGALYVDPGVKIQPVTQGGGQERGLRSGTENLFAIAGMGEAARLAGDEMDAEGARLSGIRDQLIDRILTIDESFLMGHPKNRLPHHASFRFSHIEGESILLNMDMYNIQVSTGSACSSKTLEPSHVLLAMGLRHEEAHGSMVITLGKSNDGSQVPRVVDAVKETVKRLRELSPLVRT